MSWLAKQLLHYTIKGLKMQNLQEKFKNFTSEDLVVGMSPLMFVLCLLAITKVIFFGDLG